MNPDIVQGLAQAVLPSSLAATAVGVVLGLVVGMIPGMTISSGIIIVLPLTFVLDPNISIALLLGLYVAGMTGGSFAAILLNIPGTPSASATAMDGYPMTRAGEAGRALGISITAGFAGGLFSFACLYFISPSLADLALEFRAQDLFAVVLFGLTVICSFAARSLVKGLLSAVLGLLIISVGQDPVMGTARFTFGDADLLSGIHFLTALIGLFAIPQVVENLKPSGSGTGAGPVSEAAQHAVGRVFPRTGDLLRSPARRAAAGEAAAHPANPVDAADRGALRGGKLRATQLVLRRLRDARLRTARGRDALARRPGGADAARSGARRSARGAPARGPDRLAGRRERLLHLAVQRAVPRTVGGVGRLVAVGGAAYPRRPRAAVTRNRVSAHR